MSGGELSLVDVVVGVGITSILFMKESECGQLFTLLKDVRGHTGLTLIVTQPRCLELRSW